MKTLLLIDGNAIIHRAFHALPIFKTKEGIPTNAVHGFFTMLYKAITDFKPDYVVVAFDTQAPTFRRKLLEKYQAHRPKTSDDLRPQFGLIRELLDKAGIMRFQKEGYEADDIIGTVAAHYKNNGVRTFILTGDKDILQLVNDHVFVIAPQKGLSDINVYNEEGVIKRMEVRPALVPDLKALIGDPSDNYPGVKGIGPKTALKLIKKFGSVENLLKNIGKIEDEKLRETIKQNVETLKLGKKLSKIVCDIDLEMDLQKARFMGFGPRMRPTLDQLELFALSSRLFREPKVQKPKKQKMKEENPNQTSLF